MLPWRLSPLLNPAPETLRPKILQSKDYDLDGSYIRKWVPELARVPQSHIHEPWKMPPDVASQVSRTLA